MREDYAQELGALHDLCELGVWVVRDRAATVSTRGVSGVRGVTFICANASPARPGALPPFIASSVVVVAGCRAASSSCSCSCNLQLYGELRRGPKRGLHLSRLLLIESRFRRFFVEKSQNLNLDLVHQKGIQN